MYGHLDNTVVLDFNSTENHPKILKCRMFFLTRPLLAFLLTGSVFRASPLITILLMCFFSVSDGRNQDFKVETDPETLVLGFVELRPRPRLLFWVSLDRDRD